MRETHHIRSRRLCKHVRFRFVGEVVAYPPPLVLGHLVGQHGQTFVDLHLVWVCDSPEERVAKWICPFRSSHDEHHFLILAGINRVKIFRQKKRFGFVSDFSPALYSIWKEPTKSECLEKKTNISQWSEYFFKSQILKKKGINYRQKVTNV